jgi:predicted nucleotide-binding protein (sugar kinase/HSP70/actin superfamily)
MQKRELKTREKGEKRGRILFERRMRRTHTILLPQMLPLHFELLQNVFRERGYQAELLTNEGPHIAQLGLKYVHNDTCYPALLVVGQMIDALQSGRYDLDHTALMITQTGGGCRASNYIHLLRKALERAGYAQVPVISLNLSGMESNPGFKMNLKMLRKLLAALVYGDELMLLGNQARPYEINLGETDALLKHWVEEISRQFHEGKAYSLRQLRKVAKSIAGSFEGIQREAIEKIKVGIVGEIYIKYASLGNNGLEAFLHQQDCEVMVPGVIGFGMFSLDNRLEDHRLYGGSALKKWAVQVLAGYLKKMESALISAVEATSFKAPGRFEHTRELVDGVIGHGCKMGEGWLLTAEMLELVEMGYPNIICAQPFGCLPNHIVGRGMMNQVKSIAPKANIVAIDYDPSAARVNQENRIKLMLATAGEEAVGAIESALGALLQHKPEIAAD